jgi:hypothetical protein
LLRRNERCAAHLFLVYKMSALANQLILCEIPQITRPTSTAERWADFVLRGCKSEKDLKTLGMWAHQVAVSYTTLCEVCRLIGVQPRQARDFARVLRAVLRPSFDFRQLASFLDISDRRTLESLLQSAGFYVLAARPVSVLSFLDNQQFINRDNAGLRVIREVLVPSNCSCCIVL